MNCSLPGSSVHEILQARILSRLPFLSPDLSSPENQTSSPALAGGFFTTEPPGKPFSLPLPPSSGDSTNILFSGPWDWIVTVVKRESTLYFWVSPLEWYLFKKTPPSPWNKEEELKGERWGEGGKSHQEGLSGASPPNTPAWDRSLVNKYVSLQRGRRTKVQKTSNCLSFHALPGGFLGVQGGRGRSRGFSPPRPQAGTCHQQRSQWIRQKVTCMDVAPASRWTSVDADSEVCEWPGPEGTQLSKQMQHQQKWLSNQDPHFPSPPSAW